jgi:hypothetical protein
MKTNNYGSQVLRGAALIAGLAAVLGNAVAGGVESAKQPVKPVVVRLAGEDYPATLLPEVRGAASLSMDAFAREVGGALHQHSAETGTEACAMLCRNPAGAWGASPISIGSHIACPIIEKCPEEMAGIGDGIHSHPRKGSYVVNRADKVVLRQRMYTIGTRAETGNTRVFSREDFAGGPGYMVTSGGRLFYQNGPRSVREVHSAGIASATPN